MYQQHSSAGITTLGDAHKPLLVVAGMLLRHEPDPSGTLPASRHSERHSVSTKLPFELAVLLKYKVALYLLESKSATDGSARFEGPTDRAFLY